MKFFSNILLKNIKNPMQKPLHCKLCSHFYSLFYITSVTNDYYNKMSSIVTFKVIYVFLKIKIFTIKEK